MGRPKRTFWESESSGNKDKWGGELFWGSKYLSWECLYLAHTWERNDLLPQDSAMGHKKSSYIVESAYPAVTLWSLTFDSFLGKLSLDILHFKLLPSYSCCYSQSLYMSLYFLHILWVTYTFTAVPKWNSAIVYFSVIPARLGVCQDWDNLFTIVSSG